jgi:hypothetical protein
MTAEILAAIAGSLLSCFFSYVPVYPVVRQPGRSPKRPRHTQASGDARYVNAGCRRFVRVVVRRMGGRFWLGAILRSKRGDRVAPGSAPGDYGKPIHSSVDSPWVVGTDPKMIKVLLFGRTLSAPTA